MHYAPHDYQKRAIKMMASLPGTAQLLDPGMGKTACALAALTVLQHHQRVAAMLVIAPMRPMYLTWPNEVKKWDQFAHLKVSIIHGTPKQRLAAMYAPADVYLINPENVAWLVEVFNGNLSNFGTPPGMLIVDESTRFKNARSQRFKALKVLLPSFEYHHILTGTPAPQSIEDLFAQMQIVDEGKRLGRFITYFRKSFMESESIRVAGGRTIEKWYPRKGAELEVAARIDDVALRLKAEDYLTMPAITYNIIPVTLPADVRKTYDRLAKDLVGETAGGDTLTAATSAAAVMKMRQIVNGWAYADGGSVHLHDGKVEALAELVEEQQGTPLLVAVAFLHEVPAIREALAKVLPPGTLIPYLGGGVSRTAADIIVNDWNKGFYPVVLCHPTSVAHGLNLQAGGHCLAWFGLTWSLEEHTQLVARVYRQGQTKPVVVHYLTATGTVDEDIAKALASKADVQAAILNSLKGHLK